MKRIVTVRIPEDHLAQDTPTHVVLKDGTQLERVDTVSQPIFRVTEDAHAYFDPNGEHDISGPNVIDLKKGQQVELMACQLNQEYGFSPFRYTHVLSTGERVEAFVWVSNEILEHVAGNLGPRLR